MATKCEKCGRFMKIDEGAACRSFYDEDSGECEGESWTCSDCTGWQPDLTDEELRARYEAEGEAMRRDMEAMQLEYAHLPEPAYTDEDFRITDDDIPW